MAAVEQPSWSEWVEVAAMRESREARAEALRAENETLRLRLEVYRAWERARQAQATEGAEARRCHSIDLQSLIEDLNREAEDWALETSGGDIAAAGRLLGLKRTTLSMRLQSRRKEGR